MANGMYGGTKAEMERLVADAAKMTEVQEKLGVTVDGTSLSFDNIVKAIHVVQGAYEISGYSVDQLEEKIKNHTLTEQELARVAQDNTSKYGTYEEALNAVSQAYEDGSLKAADAIILTGTTSREAQTTIEGSINSLKGAWENWLAVVANPDADFETVQLKTDQLVETLSISLDNIVPAVASIIGNVVSIVAEHGPEIADQVYHSFMDALPPEVRERFQELLDKLDELWNFILNELIPTVSEVAGEFKRWWDETRELRKGLKKVSDFLRDHVFDKLGRLAEIVSGVSGVFGELSGKVGEFANSLGITDQDISNFVDSAGDTFLTLLDPVGTMVDNVIDAFKSLPEDIPRALGNLGNVLYSAGQDLVNGLTQGIANAPTDVANTLWNTIGGGVDQLKAWLGIASPSKLFAELGGYTMEGFAQGIDREADAPRKAMLEAAGAVYGAADGSVDVSGMARGSAALAAPGGVSVVIQGDMVVREEADIDRIADLLYRKVKREQEARGWSTSFTMA